MVLVIILATLVGVQLAKSNPCSNCHPHGYNDCESESESHRDERICSSRRFWFHSKCWLDAFKEIHKADLTVSQNSKCPDPNGSFPCALFCYPVNNPVCAFNRVSGTLETFNSSCYYLCLDGGKDLDILHCGPCGISCDDVIGNLNCIGDTQPPCTVNSSDPIKKNPLVGSCSSNNYSPVCGRDTKTGNMETFNSTCELNLAKKVNPSLDSLYHSEIPGVCPCE